jgi:ELWxxDGT repeat protein
LLVIFLMALMSMVSAQAAGPAFRVKDIFPGSNTSNPGKFTPMGNKLFFAATDPTHGDELGKSNGAIGGTRLVRDIWPGPESWSAQEFTAVEGWVLFRAFDKVHDEELWKSNGMPE